MSLVFKEIEKLKKSDVVPEKIKKENFFYKKGTMKETNDLLKKFLGVEEGTYILKIYSSEYYNNLIFEYYSKDLHIRVNESYWKKANSSFEKLDRELLNKIYRSFYNTAIEVLENKMKESFNSVKKYEGYLNLEDLKIKEEAIKEEMKRVKDIMLKKLLKTIYNDLKNERIIDLKNI